MGTDVHKSGLSHSGSTDPSAEGQLLDNGLFLRPVYPSDADAVHHLLMAGLPYVPTDRQRWFRRWCWEYWDNPFRQERSAGWVLEDKDKIVGHLGAIYVPFRIDERCCTAVIGVDHVVLDNNVGGLKLAEAFYFTANDCVSISTSDNEVTGAVFTQLGYQPIQWTSEYGQARVNLTQQIRTFRGAKSLILRQILSGVGGKVLCKALVSFCRLLNRRPAIPVPRGCRLETTTPRLAYDLGTLYERITALSQRTNQQETVKMPHGSPGVFGIDRTQVYLNWRYADHPEHDNIRVLVVRDHEGDPMGATVIFVDQHNKKRIAFIEELFSLPGRHDVIRTLLSAALALAFDQKADYLVTMSGNPSNMRILKELGFESKIRPTAAASIHIPDQITKNTSPFISYEAMNEHLELWHGEMFKS